MNREVSVAAQALVDYAAGRARDALVTDAVRDYLTCLKVPAADLGGLEFAADAGDRWSRAVDHRRDEITALRDRLNETASGVLQAAADYTSTDVSAAVDISTAATDDEGHPSLFDTYRQTLSVSAVPGGEGATIATGHVQRAGHLPAHLDPDQGQETTGRNAMLSLRAEHLSTLERAEQLLRDAQRLDFKAPTVFLDELKDVCPGSVRNRAALLLAVRDNIDEVADETTHAATELDGRWHGRAASALTEQSSETVRFGNSISAELTWLHREGAELGRLLDELLQNIADDAQSRVPSVDASRMARIAEAVELVEEANTHAIGSEHAGNGAMPMWSSLSGGDVDATVRVLYKRVWYLSHAFGNSLDRAYESARELIDDTAHPAGTPASPVDRTALTGTE